MVINLFTLELSYHKRCKCKFLDNTERTSFVKRNASSNGSSDNKHMSIGSENHDLIGIALLGKHRYAPGELSIMNIWNWKMDIKRLDLLFKYLLCKVFALLVNIIVVEQRFDNRSNSGSGLLWLMWRDYFKY